MADYTLDINGTSRTGDKDGATGTVYYHDEVQSDGIVAGIVVEPNEKVRSLMLKIDDAIKIRDALNKTIEAHTK